jgi:hypothetical protein
MVTSLRGRTLTFIIKQDFDKPKLKKDQTLFYVIMKMESCSSYSILASKNVVLSDQIMPIPALIHIEGERIVDVVPVP